MVLHAADVAIHDSRLVMYPDGHARNTTADLRDILNHKWAQMADISLPEDADRAAFIDHIESLPTLDAFGVASYYDFELAAHEGYED